MPSPVRPRRALRAAVATNVFLLLGCAALQNLQKSTNTAGPAGSPTPASTAVAAASAGASPAASPTPIGSGLVERFKDANKRAEERSAERNESRERAIDAITPAQERAIGQASALNVIQASGGLVLEEGLVRYLNSVANHVGNRGERVEKGKDGIARLKARRFFVGVLDSDNMSAYSLPGGYILVTRGLLENLSCESDLAFVLGHEIAHVDLEHGLKAVKQLFVIEQGKQALGAGSTRSPLDDPGFFGKVADQLADVTYRVGLQREDEREADRLGTKYAIQAGYDSRGAKRVLELLAAHSASVTAAKTGLVKYVQPASHDSPARRLENLADLVDSAPGGKLGVERFETDGLLRLEAAKRARAANGP